VVVQEKACEQMTEALGGPMLLGAAALQGTQGARASEEAGQASPFFLQGCEGCSSLTLRQAQAVALNEGKITLWNG
jgi:hypothetical protein